MRCPLFVITWLCLVVFVGGQAYAVAHGADGPVTSTTTASHHYDGVAQLLPRAARGAELGVSDPELAAVSIGTSSGQPTPFTQDFVAADTGFNAGLDATKLNMTRTVERHIGEYAKDGTLARPYTDSRLTIQNVMDSVKPTADPGGVPGALRWDAPGSMNGSNGTWELVVDPSTNTILHFMFRGAH